MDWNDIPSLFALRAFEATARLESLTTAAQSLNVTHAAISQHIRALEAEMGCILTRRSGRGIALTPEGQRLAQALSDGFGTIAAATRELRDQTRERPLVVAITPAFGENWLMPRLGKFWVDHPEIQISLLPSPALVDLRRDRVDLAIRFGKGDWPDVKIEKLVRANFVAVATPERIRLSPDPETAPWFISTPDIEFSQWARMMHLITDRTPVTELPTGELVLSACRAGHGFSIHPRALVESDIAKGTLAVHAEAAEDAHCYFIVTPKDGMTPKAKAFVQWLRCCA